jgi:fumarylacetoacetase
MNKTHSPDSISWVDSANLPDSDFPIQNLPFGIFKRRGSNDSASAGVALGDQVISIRHLHEQHCFTGAAEQAAACCQDGTLNRLMSQPPDTLSSLRRSLFELYGNGNRIRSAHLAEALVPMAEVDLVLPVNIGDYTDFYASIHHATNVGSMFRPDNPLLPNYKHMPIGYHGRSSSIVMSGTGLHRPRGQSKREEESNPSFGPCRMLDYELEVGFFIGQGNILGKNIPVALAHNHLFGACLLNDWSARDIQKWEYQPLGPFLAKNFATSISPWIVTSEALEPFRTNAFLREKTDPSPLPHLTSDADLQTGGLNITLEVFLSTDLMRKQHIPPMSISRGNFKEMYWTVAQMIAHHTSNGCNLRPGDLLGSGTVSGPEPGSRGCLLEMTQGGKNPVQLPTGEQRRFLEDGDEVIMRGYCETSGHRRIGFGECRGMILPTQPASDR